MCAPQLTHHTWLCMSPAVYVSYLPYKDSVLVAPAESLVEPSRHWSACIRPLELVVTMDQIKCI